MIDFYFNNETEHTTIVCGRTAGM